MIWCVLLDRVDGVIARIMNATSKFGEQFDSLADMIAFGRPFISNPDLLERFKNKWPLNPFADMSYWYSPGEQGYTDYEPYQESAA